MILVQQARLFACFLNLRKQPRVVTIGVREEGPEAEVQLKTALGREQERERGRTQGQKGITEE
jgi:hypothetical protein